MKLVVNRKEPKPPKPTVRNVLRDALSRANEFRNVVVIVETKEGSVTWVASRMKDETLLFTAEVGLNQIRDELLGRI